jgi:hypothetical protein
VFQNYFTDLFTSSNPTNMQESLHVVADRVHPQMYDYLNKDFTAAEVSYATHQLKSDAAPGHDGLNAKIFQAHLDIIGNNITQVAIHILNNGGNPAIYNDTYICLIPKHKNPTTPADFKYLGMPTQIGHSKQTSFNYIMDKVRNKLKGWKERNLSYAGKSILISAVIQALPTYVMSCFLLPKVICDQIEQTMCRFWSGSRDRHQKIHRKAKKSIFKSKLAGGMGFRDMHLFNIAMLAKQVWRLQTNPHSLLAQCLKAKYYPNSDIIHAPRSRSASYAWQSIYQAIDTIKKGSCWKVGNGQSIKIWEDNWVIGQNGYKILTPYNGQPNTSKVSDIINEGSSRSWNHGLIDQTFFSFKGTLIKQIPLIEEPIEDQLMWPHAKDGCYMVKSGYNLLSQWSNANDTSSAHPNSQDKTWKKLWSLHTIPRHKFLIWRIIQKVVPVRSELSKREVNCNVLCPRCLMKEETI